MGSFLENIVKHVDLGSVLGSAAGGGLQDILGKLGGTEAPEPEEKTEAVETAGEPQGSLQDILGQLTAGGGIGILGKLGGLATGSINVINIAKEALGGKLAGTQAKEPEAATGDDGFEDVE